MNTTDNPAGRLLIILNKSLKINEQTKMRVAWAEIFEINPENTSEILRKLGEVNQLPAKIRKKIYSLDDINQELHLKKLGSVETALSRINFTSRWQIFKKIIDEATLLSIEHCSDVLSYRLSEKVLNDKDLSNLKDKVHNFKNELSELDIEPALKKFIFDKVSEIGRAIFDYELTGTASIQKEVECALGSSFLHGDLLKKDENATKKFFEFIGYVSSIVHLVEYGPLLKEQATLLIGQ